MVQTLNKRSTIVDVAAAAGVSIKTVSRVINNSPSVSVDTRDRVMRAVATLDFAPDARARGLAGQRTGMIGMVAPGLASVYSFYLFDIMRGVLDRAEAAGLRTLILPDSPAKSDRKDEYVRFLRERHADGLIVLLRPENRARVAGLMEAELPAVTIDDGLLNPDIPCVTADNRQSSRAAVEHLIRLGHRRIAHIAGMSVFGCSHEREAGYREAMEAAGLGEHVVVAGGDHHRSTGRIETERLLDSACPPTAVFCACDDTALGAMDAAHARGLTVGRDFSCVGFNDTRLASEASPALTTVHQPLVEFGRRATERLLDLIENGRTAAPPREVLPCHLVVRSSCGAPAHPLA